LPAQLGPILILTLLVGCGASALVGPDAVPQEVAVLADGDGLDSPAAEDVSADGDADAGGDAPACCPPDPGPVFGGCVHLGGMNRYQCHAVCDFWCSTNWRIERDEGGCEVWRMDYRKPAPGENDLCFPGGDAGRG
jgi:hypothetical protein